MILITGATGKVGSELIKKLSGGKHAVRALVRDRKKAGTIALPGIEVVEGDFTKPKTLSRALDGVEQLFLLLPSSSEVEQLQCNFVDAARKHRVKHIVKLSQLGADKRSSGRFQRYHGAVEDHMMKSGVAYTFLRPNLFMQGLLNFRTMISSQGAFFAPAGNARVSVVDVRDIASIAKKMLTESGHEGKAYDITGPEALTHLEMAEQLSQATGRSIGYVSISPESMRETLLSIGLQAWQAEGVVEDYEHYRRGEAERVTSTVRDLTGYEGTFFSQFAMDYAGSFSGKAAGKA